MSNSTRITGHAALHTDDKPTRIRVARGTGIDDVALAQRCLRGEQAAWGELVGRYEGLVRVIVRRAGLDEHHAADVCQTVFSRLVQHLPRIGNPSRLRAWLVTSARREAMLLSRRGRLTVSLTRDPYDDTGPDEWDVADDAPTAEAALDERQQLHRLQQALDRLEPRQRDMMRMLFDEDAPKVSYEAVSARLGMPPGSIGPTRARCLQKLRAMLSAREAAGHQQAPADAAPARSMACRVA